MGETLDFLPIGIEDKQLFDRYFGAQRFENSHCNFTTRFIWRRPFGLKWTVIDGCLCTIGVSGGEHFALPPVGLDRSAVGAALDKVAAYFHEHGWPLIFRDVEQSLAQAMEELRPGRYSFREDRGNFDYVYDVQALIALKGRKFHAKKNQVNTFRRLYSGFRVAPLTETRVASCLEVAREWAANRARGHRVILYEQEAISEALSNFAALQLVGSVIEVGGKVAAFTFGERLNEDTAVVHVEKADTAFKGVYSTINREFCAAYWQDMKYINRQEDLGIPGLRKAKESYHPVKMIKKYIAVARN